MTSEAPVCQTRQGKDGLILAPGAVGKPGYRVAKPNKLEHETKMERNA